MEIKKAERKQAKLRLGLDGQTDGGKTWSALEIATGIIQSAGGRIGVIETEKRAHLYANDFDFDIIEIDAPYSPEKGVTALKLFEKNGYTVVIWDSLTHFWNGEGGVLDIVTKAGGQFQKGWEKGTPQQNKMVEAIMTSPAHIIVTVRSKMEYVLEPTVNREGKTVYAPKQIGLAPIQRGDLEYEFTVWAHMTKVGDERIANIVKDNTRLYTNQCFQPTKDMGIKLVEWLSNGVTQAEIENQKLAEITSSLNNHKHAISVCESMDELKSAFIMAAREFKDNDIAIAELTAVKDAKKEILTAVVPGKNTNGPEYNQEFQEAA